MLSGWPPALGRQELCTFQPRGTPPPAAPQSGTGTLGRTHSPWEPQAIWAGHSPSFLRCLAHDTRLSARHWAHALPLQAVHPVRPSASVQVGWGGKQQRCPDPPPPPQQARRLITLSSAWPRSPYVLQTRRRQNPPMPKLDPPKNRLPDNYLFLSGAGSSGGRAGWAAWLGAASCSS